MFTIAFLIPYPQMESLVRAVWDEHNEAMKLDDPQYVPEYEVVIELGSTQAAERLLKRADVLVVRGGTATMIKETFPDTYFVELPISGSDLMSVVQRALSEQGNQPIAMIGTFNMLYSAERMLRLMGMGVHAYYAKDVTYPNLQHMVDVAVNDGNKIIMGGLSTLKAAKEKGVHGYIIESSRESIWMAISEAKRLCIIVRKEREKASLFKAVMDSSKEGILAVNKMGQVIAINSAAADLLNIDTTAEKRENIDTLVQDSALSTLFKNDIRFSDEIVKTNRKHLSLNKVEVHLNNESIGYVTTLQDITRIMEAESKIRDKMFSRGHTARFTFSDIVGDSPAMRSAILTAKRCSKTNSNILIWGESGTGKELFAQSVHKYSSRADKPFVAVNCAALPENLLESELFGYVEGAFTGASKGGKPGMFELAHRGTIFLDEISEIPQRLQGRLLRVIQEREVMRLGHDRVIPVDVRIVCATNKDLFALVKDGEFREDLYYRLNVLTIRLPPIREHKEDIVKLAKHFLREYATENKCDVPQMDKMAQTVLTDYEWGGNIRELRNICERLSVFNETGVISCDDVLLALEKPAMSPEEPENVLLSSSISEHEKKTILQALAQTGGNKNQAAKLLGISRTTMWRKSYELGIY